MNKHLLKTSNMINYNNRRKDIVKTESELFKELKDLTKKFENDLIHRTFIYDELVEQFHMYMPNLISYSPLNLYTNPLSNFIRFHIGTNIPGCIIEEYQIYEEQDDFKMDLQEIEDYYKSLIEDDTILSQKEFAELIKLALLEREESQFFIRYLLGQIIEGNNTVSETIKNTLLSRYFGNLLSENDLYFKWSTKEDSAINNEFQNKTISVLYSMFYEAWKSVQLKEEYNEPEIISMIKIDNYFRESYGEDYYDENKAIFTSEVDANLNATLFLADFLQEVSPVTYHEHKAWLSERAKTLIDQVYDRERFFKGEKYNIDEIFDQTLEYTGETKEEIVGTIPENSKVYQKEIRI